MITIDVIKNLLTADGPMPLTVKLTINKKDFFTFFGPSGAGKTTTLRMLAGLTTPGHGIITVNGETWFDSAKKIDIPVRNRKIGFVFQDYALFPTMTVRKNLEYANGKDHNKINLLIDMMQLRAFENSKPSELSGGQRQRVALARALVQSPEILLLDEPLSALDHEMRRTLQNEISQIHTEFGLTSIIVTHDITEIFHLSNQVACFKQGKVSKSGSPEDIFNQRLSSKFRVAGTIIDIKRSDVAAVVTIQVGISLTKVVIDCKECDSFYPGQKVIVAAKAFTPILLPADENL
jgi:molybdate transport system ATP-binding protein